MRVPNWKTTIAATLFAVACAMSGLAQVAPIVLKIDTDNGVRYIYDTTDLTAFATVPNPLSQMRPTFAIQMILADVVSVNDKPAKGILMTRQFLLNLRPDASAGQAIGDLVRAGASDRILELLQPDGTPIGSLTMLGFDGGTPPPGGPASTARGSFAITGGTGAFLGVRGQLVSAGNPENRNASIREDPAQRRHNGGGKGLYYAQLIPMSRPEVTLTPNGPAIVHSHDFSLVTAANPARPGEILSLFATGLGPTRPGVDPDRPFPQTPLQTVNSPVEVAVNGRPAEVLAAVGLPGSVGGYQVNFRLPPDTVRGSATLQVSAAWIPGPEVRIAVQ